jgi:hypothetical protein
MGMPFPTALNRLGLQARALVPWAWGMNGVFSVLGSSTVILASMLTSFSLAMLGAAVFYGAAALLSTYLWRVHVTVDERRPGESASQIPVAESGPTA